MKRKISGENTNLIVGGVVLLAVGTGLYFLFKNGNPFASNANSSNNQAIDQNTASSTASTLNTLAQQNVTPSLTAAQASGLATDIYNKGMTGDQQTIISDLNQCVNDADIYLIMQYFGTKQAATSFLSTCNLLGFNCSALDLPSWVKSVLDQDQIDQINSNYQQDGMSFQF